MIRAKPLEWGAWNKGFCLHTWNSLASQREAKTPHGRYSLGRLHKHTKSTDPVNRAFDYILSNEWYVEAPFSKDLLGPFGNDVEAIKAAQAHADQVVRDMAQPVRLQDAARVLLDEFDIDMNSGAFQFLTELATPPQEKDHE